MYFNCRKVLKVVWLSLVLSHAYSIAQSEKPPRKLSPIKTLIPYEEEIIAGSTFMLFILAIIANIKK